MKIALQAWPLLAALVVWAPSPAQAGETVEVRIEKMQFVPNLLKIREGTTVNWINLEKRNNHSVFFEQDGWPESDRLFPGETWQRTFDHAGVFSYRCGPHPEMTGTVEVTQ